VTGCWECGLPNFASFEFPQCCRESPLNQSTTEATGKPAANPARCPGPDRQTALVVRLDEAGKPRFLDAVRRQHADGIAHVERIVMGNLREGTLLRVARAAVRVSRTTALAGDHTRHLDRETILKRCGVTGIHPRGYASSLASLPLAGTASPTSGPLGRSHRYSRPWPLSPCGATVRSRDTRSMPAPSVNSS
jgi:hypothetical protein